MKLPTLLGEKIPLLIIDSLKKYCDKIVDLLKNRDFIIKVDEKLGFSKKLKKDL